MQTNGLRVLSRCAVVIICNHTMASNPNALFQLCFDVNVVGGDESQDLETVNR